MPIERTLPKEYRSVGFSHQVGKGRVSDDFSNASGVYDGWSFGDVTAQL